MQATEVKAVKITAQAVIAHLEGLDRVQMIQPDKDFGDEYGYAFNLSGIMVLESLGLNPYQTPYEYVLYLLGV